MLIAVFLFLLSWKGGIIENNKNIKKFEVPTSIIYFKLPINAKLNLQYYDDYLQPVEVFIEGKGIIDSIVINNNSITFLENYKSIYDYWAIQINPNDKIYLENTDSNLLFKNYTINNLVGPPSRKTEVNFYNEYNKWKEENKSLVDEHQSKMAYWKGKKNLDSIVSRLESYNNKRIRFLDSLKNKKYISQDFYNLTKNDFYAAIQRGKLLNAYSFNKNIESENYIKEYFKFLNNLPSKYINYHVISVIETLFIDPKESNRNKILNSRINYFKQVSQQTKGYLKEILLVRFLVHNYKVPELKKYYDSVILNIKDPAMLSYIKYQIINKNSFHITNPDNTYIFNSKTNVINLDSSLIANKGKKILVNFWASWCSPCLSELRDIIPASKLYSQKDYLFIYLSVDDSRSSWEIAAKNLGIDDIGNSFLLINSLKSKILTQYAINGFPTSLFLILPVKCKLKK